MELREKVRIGFIVLVAWVMTPSIRMLVLNDDRPILMRFLEPSDVLVRMLVSSAGLVLFFYWFFYRLLTLVEYLYSFIA